MSPRSSLSLLLLVSSLTACTQPIGDAEQTTQSEDELILTPTFPTLTFADPTKGLVGRGYNRRAPLSRLRFNSAPVTMGGGWSEVAATDRAQCVDFSGGIVAPSATPPMRVSTRTLLVDSRAKFLEASTFSGGQTGEANVVLPIEGIPVPVGATLDRTIGSESRTDVSAETVDLTLIAKAVVLDPIRGSGNATIRTAVINDVNAFPAGSARKNAFFAKCGDRYLDSLTMGGAIAIDVSLFMADATVFRKLKAKVNDSMNLGLGGASGAEGAAADANGADALAALLDVLSVSGSSNVNADSSFTFEGKTGTLRMNVRTLGPVLDTTNLTIDQAIQIVSGWGSRIQTKPAERAVLGAVQKTYSTTTNASLLSGSLPGELDVAYATMMEQVREYYLTHYMVLNAFGDLERDLVVTPIAERAEAWFDTIPSNTTITTARRTALQHAFANARAMECLVEIAPGSATSVYTACLTQAVVGDTSTSSTLGSKFPRLVRNIPSFGTSTINVGTVGHGLGLYPAIPRRRARLAITSTFADFHQPLAAEGINSPVGTQEDKLSNACNIANIDGRVVFRSGPADDGDWLTGSRCDWSAFNGLGARLRTGWTVRGTYAKRVSGSNPGGYWDAPGAFDTVGAIEGTVKAEKWLSTWSGVQLLNVEATGPIAIEQANLFLVPGAHSIRLALRPQS